MKKTLASAAIMCVVALIAASSAASEGTTLDPALWRTGQSIVLAPDLLAAAPATAPMNAQCNGVLTGTYHDVVVPTGANCRLVGATVTGNVTVQHGGGLVSEGSNIHGNLQASGASYIGVYAPGSMVGGNIQLDHTLGVPPGNTANYICHTPVGNDLQIGHDSASAPFNVGGVEFLPGSPPNPDDACGVSNSVGGNIQTMNNAGELWISDNQVHGNLQAGSNTGGLHIYRDTIGGNLQCTSNTEVDGAGDTASSYSGQCSGPAFVYP